MNAYGKNSRILNSLIPTKNTPLVANIFRTNSPNVTSSFITFTNVLYIVIVALLVTAAVLLYYYWNDVVNGWDTSMDLLNTYYEKATPLPELQTPASKAVLPSAHEHQTQQQQQHQQVNNIVQKVLPGGSEVFNISSNKFTYYDAEPLCSALGAELATYDQVKEAWSKGADWCNYGWVKGQMAVYPTSAETYKKIQSGPEDGRTSCGQIGVNGGYFDNPELKYGVTCYGKKPPQTSQSSADVTKNTPTSPDALAYEHKVNQFKAQSDSFGILPFNKSSWSS
jgi:hypothetical protein